MNDNKRNLTSEQLKRLMRDMVTDSTIRMMSLDEVAQIEAEFADYKSSAHRKSDEDMARFLSELDQARRDVFRELDEQDDDD